MDGQVTDADYEGTNGTDSFHMIVVKHEWPTAVEQSHTTWHDNTVRCADSTNQVQNTQDGDVYLAATGTVVEKLVATSTIDCVETTVQGGGPEQNNEFGFVNASIEESEEQLKQEANLKKRQMAQIAAQDKSRERRRVAAALEYAKYLGYWQLGPFAGVQKQAVQISTAALQDLKELMQKSSVRGPLAIQKACEDVLSQHRNLHSIVNIGALGGIQKITNELWPAIETHCDQQVQVRSKADRQAHLWLDYVKTIVFNVVLYVLMSNVRPELKQFEDGLDTIVERDEFVDIFQTSPWQNELGRDRLQDLYAILTRDELTARDVINTFLWLGPGRVQNTVPAAEIIKFLKFAYVDATGRVQAMAGASEFCPFLTRQTADEAYYTNKAQIVRLSCGLPYTSEGQTQLVWQGLNLTLTKEDDGRTIHEELLAWDGKRMIPVSKQGGVQNKYRRRTVRDRGNLPIENLLESFYASVGK